MEPKNWGECYYDHYVQYMGPPAARWHYDPKRGRSNIQILRFDGVFPDSVTLCSIGLTHYRDNIGCIAEVMLLTDGDVAAITFILAEVLHQMVSRGIELHWGARIGGLQNVDASFVSQFHKSAIYFSPQWALPDAFTEVSCGDAIGGVYQAIFLSDAEYRFLTDRGAEEFETLLMHSGVDAISLERASCV